MEKGGDVYMKIDINCDMGESFGAYKLGNDEDIIKHITSASIACGWHAGDPTVMRKTIQMAKENAVAVGAHPGYPDLLGFGRRKLDCTHDELKDYMIYQVGALQAFAKALGTKVEHFKSHGMLGNQAIEEEKIALPVAEAVASLDKNLIFVIMAGAKGAMLREVAKKVGIPVAYEGLADRAYTPEGTLVSRREAGAVIKDPEKVVERAVMMVKGKVVAIDGTEIPLKVHTICVHGDTPGSADLLRRIRERLVSEKIEIAPMRSVI
jgi:UPF0271 protein